MKKGSESRRFSNELRELLSKDLERCRDFGDVFSVVKKAVRMVLGLGRVGLMLYIGDLPPKIFAYHVLGTNGIVINRKLLRAVSRSTLSDIEFNSTLFLILLHEYLHSLGYVDEQRVKGLVYRISKACFGEEHPVTEKALLGPEYGLHLHGYFGDNYNSEGFVLVKNFEKTDKSYIY